MMEFPDNEAQRLERLYSCNLLDSPNEPSFDEITRLACILCDTPSSMISLIDADRQWFKSRQGSPVQETSRTVSFCSHAIIYPNELMIIEDATTDDRFKDNPFVRRKEGIRFYAGAPLVTNDGFALGTLCVIDTRSRTLTEPQKEGLRLLANRVEELIETRNINQSLEKFELVINNTLNSVIITDADGIIEYVNPAFERFTGYTSEEMRGKLAGRLHAGEKTDEYQLSLIENALLEGITVCQEICNYTKSGRPYWITCQVKPVFDEDGNHHKFVIVQSDITSLKEKQEELIEAQEQAQESARLKQEFLSNMSHEIRTPMNGIIGLSNLLLEEGKLSSAELENVKHINTSSKNLLRLINDILDFSKANSGKLSFRYEDFDLSEVFESLQKTMNVLAGEKGINFEIKLDNDLPEIVHGDSHRLYQILLNLAGNAVKFTDFGNVTVDVGILEENERGLCLQVEVRDTGQGIPKDKLTTIFNEFEQVKGRTRNKSGGTFLGLSIAKKLVEMYQGTIQVESQEGLGSTFSFTVQLNYPQSKNQPKKEVFSPTNSLQPEGAKVLLVEDNYVNQLVTKRYLERGGCEVIVANNGKEGVQAYQDNSFDLIIMDVQMPIMNGLEATQTIRSMDSNIPIIGMTASVMDKDLELCIAAGMDSHLLKPFQPEELNELLTNYFSKESRKAVLGHP